MNDAQILVCTFAAVPTTQQILEQYFGARSDSTIQLDNKYFKATVTARIVPQSEHDVLTSSDDWKRDLSSFPAIALISADQEPATIAKCKTLWSKLCGTVSEDTARLLFADGDGMSEKDTYQLVEWGVTSRIEVVNSFVCREDDIAVSDRLRNILECAPWPSTLQKISGKEETVNDFKPLSISNDMSQNRTTQDRSLLQNSTRLRRGLQKKDVTRLVDELLLEDESDSDT